MSASHTQTGVRKRFPGGRRFVLLLLVGLAALTIFFRPYTRAKGWANNYEAGLAQSVQSQAPLLISFYLEGCALCDVMERDVLTDRDVQRTLNRFVPVRLNVEQNRELANQLQVLGTPTFSIISPEGKLIRSCEGYRSVTAFLDFLNLDQDWASH